MVHCFSNLKERSSTIKQVVDNACCSSSRRCWLAGDLLLFNDAEGRSDVIPPVVQIRVFFCCFTNERLGWCSGPKALVESSGSSIYS
ncbi:unnamed protein product [Pieris macdunnoughi]|uniref:Uncharacterized protein n=1 Tax=Pieris macdunnoughi TaxID=345717 RepID=A0A821V6D5_9NEOP|nr:unnamed protein product [Pieris macdunnoughi]